MSGRRPRTVTVPLEERGPAAPVPTSRSLRRWAGSWRVAVRIARRDAVRDRGRTALVAAMIGLPVFVGAAAGTLLQSTVVTPVREMSWTLAPGVQAQVGQYLNAGMAQDPRGGSMWGGYQVAAPPVTDYESALAASIPAGDRLVRTTTGAGAAVGTNGVSHPLVTITELPLGEMDAIVVPRVADGALPTAPGEVALSRAGAEQLHAHVGDEIQVTPEGADGAVRVRVSGILAAWPRADGILAASGALLGEPADARGTAADGVTGVSTQWYVLGDTPVTWSDVTRINALGSLVTSRAVVLDPPDVPSLNTTDDGMGTLTAGIVGGVAALGLVEAILLVGPAFAVGARRSRRQLAVLAATGADHRTMRRVVLSSGLVTGLLASVSGVALGVGIAALVRWLTVLRGSFDLPDLRLPWWMPPGLVVLATLVATGAALVPARHTSRIDVVAALAGRRTEASPHPAVPIAGAALAAIGVGAAIAGATTARSVLVIGGIVVLEIGLVLAAGGIVSLVALLAPRLPLAGRFAVRDAARQRGRTAPALAAILAAIAGLSTALIYVASNEHHNVEAAPTLGAAGTVAIGAGWPGPGTAEPRSPTEDDLSTAERVLRDDLTGATVARVSVAVPHGLAPGVDISAMPVATDTGGGSAGALRIAVVRAASQECPLWADDLDAPSRLTRVDGRCVGDQERSGAMAWMDPDTSSTVLVDDGTAIRVLGTPAALRAADALAAGKVVVRSAHDLQPDGTVRVEVQDASALSGGTRVTVARVDLPAVVADLRDYEQLALVLPPQAVEPLGLSTRPAGLVASTTVQPTYDQVSAVQDDLDLGLWSSGVYVQRPPGGLGYVVWILVVAALVVGLGATAVSLALAGAESRPDLATLGAVGAAPRMRRRIAAAQAGVLVVTGTVLGVATGVALGHVLVLQRRLGGRLVDPTWTTTIPWSALAAVVVGVPLLTMTGTWLLTRSRLPMVRRVVG